MKRLVKYPLLNKAPAKPPISWEALEFIRPLGEWYSYMTEEQKRNMPIRVLNALDSVKELMGSRRV